MPLPIKTSPARGLDPELFWTRWTSFANWASPISCRCLRLDIKRPSPKRSWTFADYPTDGRGWRPECRQIQRSRIFDRIPVPSFSHFVHSTRHRDRLPTGACRECRGVHHPTQSISGAREACQRISPIDRQNHFR